MGVPWSGRNKDKTNIETKSLIPNNICDNEKYMLTTKYVTITPPQKVQDFSNRKPQSQQKLVKKITHFTI